MYLFNYCNFKETVEFDITDIDKASGNWTDYIKGVICALRRRGIEVCI